jgi:hypothetical protein
MNQIITALIAVAAVLMPGCKSPSVLVDVDTEKNLVITTNRNQNNS